MDAATILAGNAVSFAGEMCGLVSGLHKSRTLQWFTARLLVIGIANAILGAWLALWINLVSVGRNLFLQEAGEIKMPLRLGVSATMLLGLLLLKPGAGIAQHAAEAMSVVACVVFTIFMRADDEHLKWLTFVTTIPWLFYNWLVFNFVGAGFCVLSLVANLVGVLRIRVNRREFCESVAGS